MEFRNVTINDERLADFGIEGVQKWLKWAKRPLLGLFYPSSKPRIAKSCHNTPFYTSYINRAYLHDHFDTLVESIQPLLDILDPKTSKS